MCARLTNQVQKLCELVVSCLVPRVAFHLVLVGGPLLQVSLTSPQTSCGV